MHLHLSSLSISPLLLSSPPSLPSSPSILPLTLPTPPSSLPPAGFYCPPVLLPPIARSSSSSPLGNQAKLTDISSCRHKGLNYNAAPSQLTPFELVLTIVFLMASPEPSEPNVSLSLDWWLTDGARSPQRRGLNSVCCHTRSPLCLFLLSDFSWEQIYCFFSRKKIFLVAMFDHQMPL